MQRKLFTETTIFTTVSYYKEDNELKHRSAAILPENLNHYTIGVYQFQKIITDYLTGNSKRKQISYFTDGAVQNFKNSLKLQSFSVLKKITQPDQKTLKFDLLLQIPCPVHKSTILLYLLQNQF